MDLILLEQAIEKSLLFYQKIPRDRTFPLGEIEISAARLQETLVLFLDHLKSGKVDPVSLSRSFDLFGIRPDPGKDGPLVTGYYEPVLDASLKLDDVFRHPIYSLPPDLVTVDLRSFDPDKFPPGERLVGRLQENRLIPYFTRLEIDGEGKLENSDCHLAWLKDPVDVFFLHIQGSGVLRLPDGTERRVGYAGTNGRPYRSVGKYLIERGFLPAEGISMQVIKDFLKAHPELRQEVLGHNESYVFFRWVQEGPVGSLNVVLTEGRSIATDPQFHPRGGLAFLETTRPRVSKEGKWVGTEPLSRWVLNQDAGGAIKGIGRVDLFCGTGETAEWTAGRMKYPGRIYFLLKKQPL